MILLDLDQVRGAAVYVRTSSASAERCRAQEAVLPHRRLGAYRQTACLTASWGAPDVRGLMAFARGCPGRGLRDGRCQPMLLKGLLDSPCGGDAETLVDLSACVRCAAASPGLPSWRRPGRSFQGARFLRESAEVACDGQRLGVMLAGLVWAESGMLAHRGGSAPQPGRAGTPRSRNSARACWWLAAQPGSPGLLLHETEVVEGLGLAEQVAEVTEQRQGLLVGWRRRPGSPRSPAARRRGR